MANQACRNCGKQFEPSRAGQDICPNCENKLRDEKQKQ